MINQDSADIRFEYPDKKGWMYDILKTIIKYFNTATGKLKTISRLFQEYSVTEEHFTMPKPSDLQSLVQVDWTTGDYNITVAVAMLEEKVKMLIIWSNKVKKSSMANSDNVVDLINSITAIDSWLKKATVQFNKIIWRSELHLIFSFMMHPDTGKKLVPLFYLNDGVTKKTRKELLGIITPSMLTTVMLVSYTYY